MSGLLFFAVRKDRMICFFSGVFAWAVWYFAWLKEPDLFFVCLVCLGGRFGIFPS